MDCVEGYWLALGVSELPLDFVFEEDLDGVNGAFLAGMHEYIFPIFVAYVVDVGWFLVGVLFEVDEQLYKVLELWGVGLMCDEGD